MRTQYFFICMILITGSYVIKKDGEFKGIGRVDYYLQDNERPLTEFHTYAIEWSPEIIIWYFDGKVVGNAFHEPEITDQPMYLKVNYAIDNWKRDTICHNTALFPLDMVIDYVYVYQLNCDCGKNNTVNITNNSELSTQSKSVKDKITVGTSSGTITVPSPGIALRATQEITIESNFEVPLGVEFMAVVHDCPCPLIGTPGGGMSTDGE